MNKISIIFLIISIIIGFFILYKTLMFYIKFKKDNKKIVDDLNKCKIDIEDDFDWSNDYFNTIKSDFNKKQDQDKKEWEDLVNKKIYKQQLKQEDCEKYDKMSKIYFKVYNSFNIYIGYLNNYVLYDNNNKYIGYMNMILEMYDKNESYWGNCKFDFENKTCIIE